MLAIKVLFFLFPFIFIQKANALNLQSYQFSESYRYSLLNDSMKERFPGRYVITTSIGHVNSPFYYSDTYLHEMRREIIDSNQVLTVGASYYLNDKLAVGLDLSGVHNEVFGESHTTLGDTVLKSRYNLTRSDDFSLSLNPKVYLPTGKEENFSTMGSVSGSLSVVAEKSIDKFHLLASIGGLSSKDNVYADVDHRQLLLTQLGVSYDFTEKFNLNLESYRNFPLVHDNYQDEGKYFLTGKHKSHEKFSTYFGAGVSGWDELQRNTYSAFVGLKFHETAPVAQNVALSSAAPQRQTITTPTNEIYFSHDRSDLKDLEKEKLNHYVQFLHDAGNEIEHVTIEGYASSPGTPEYNMKLSRKRANSVKEFLIEQGLQGNIFSIEAFGESAPQDPVESKNRKVIFKFKD
mgnify:FL=1